MEARPTIPVIILSGFLGAGKSTLLNELLARPDMSDTGVIINEFGEIPIDHDLVLVAQRELVITKTGCICCTVGSDLRTSLLELHDATTGSLNRPLKRVIVETTGLADPAPLVNQLIAGFAPTLGLRAQIVAERFDLAGFICVVDSTAVLQTLEDHFECLKQIAFADRIVLTKSDLGPADRKRLVKRLRVLNRSADILDRQAPKFELVSLFEPRAYGKVERSSDVEGWLALEQELSAEPQALAVNHGKRHAGGIKTSTVIYDAPVDPEALANFVSILTVFAGSRLLRLKGIVCVSDDPDHPYVLHAVQHNIHPSTRLETWPSDDRRTRFVLITQDFEEDGVRKLFNALILPKKSFRRLASAALAMVAVAVILAGGIAVSAWVAAVHAAGDPHLGTVPATAANSFGQWSKP